jgi:hypothetical protein
MSSIKPALAAGSLCRPLWMALSLPIFLCCKPQGGAQPAQPPAEVKSQEAAAPSFPDAEQVVLIDSVHDTLSAARLGLEAALRLPVKLPLPYPRVERHADRFRVLLARGPFSMLRPLHKALLTAGHAVQVLAAGQAGGDDVIRLGIVCTEGESVPLYAATPGAPGKEIARLSHGQVVVLKEDEEELRGAHEGDDEPTSETAERGLLTVLQPQQGLVRGPDVLLPPDCTPRDEDNDDGNGRILGAVSGIGRLCLTTRYSGRAGHLSQADVLAVSPNYRRCLHFPGAGTFDGFDHSRSGNHFAVEVDESLRNRPSADKAAPLIGLRLYAVDADGALQVRGQWPGLHRPAFLGDHLVALSEDAASLGVLMIPNVGRREAGDATPVPPPTRIASLAADAMPRLPDKAPVHRPAAPVLSGDRVRASFVRGCRPEWAKRVKQAAGPGYVLCTLEVEVEVGLHGEGLTRRCKLDNAENSLEEAISIPCP